MELEVGLGVEFDFANDGSDGAAVEKAPKKSDAKSQTSSGFFRSKNWRKSARRARSSGCRLI